MENETNVSPLPNEDQVFGLVVSMLGANRVKVQCMDGEERMCRIPGSMRKSEWIREDDIVIVEPWEWQDEKADVEYRYDNSQVNELKDDDIISPE